MRSWRTQVWVADWLSGPAPYPQNDSVTASAR